MRGKVGVSFCLKVLKIIKIIVKEKIDEMGFAEIDKKYSVKAEKEVMFPKKK